MVQESSRLESEPRTRYAAFLSRQDWLQGSNHCPAHGLPKYSQMATYFMKFLELYNHVLDSGESISHHDVDESALRKHFPAVLTHFKAQILMRDMVVTHHATSRMGADGP